MPELPEVETVRRGLNKIIIGKTLADFDCDTKKLINQPVAVFLRTIKGRKVLSVDRRAKMLILELSGDWRILVHLKMTGQLVFGGDPNKFTHATFTFSDGSNLFYNDVRKFGWLKLLRPAELDKYLEHLQLGPEPLSLLFTRDSLQEALRKRPTARIKQFLMDNRNVVGIGNIYSDEICFFARVRPDRRVKTLTEKEIGLIFKGIKKILPEAIKYEGTSISDYVNALGEAGAYTKRLKVYGRYGDKCKLCGGEVKKMKIGGRTSSICSRCQK